MKINDIFECADGIFPKEALDLCKDCKAYITEIVPVDGVRRFQIVGIPEPTLSEVRTAALSRIDSSTQSSILAGFEYTINNEYLHFSYQYEDQQNFSDTFNGIAMKKLMGVDSLPETIGWNGWKNHTSTNKGELVRLDLDIDSFLELYTKGALAHKSYHMTIHGERKKAIESAQSVEQINALLKEWSV